MRAAGDALRQSDVRAVYLVHGTFAGNDALGLVGVLGRLLPAVAKPLAELQKGLVDAVAGDAGNYTANYAARLESALHQESAARIPVHRFHWSSENHHLGRADAAIRLIHQLLREHRGGRALLWGHSHAGNVFALANQLLASDAALRADFFSACRCYFRVPWIGRIDLPLWQEVQQQLADAPPLSLDIVTFGTPIRYGWHASQGPRLLHFINHRPVQGLSPWRAPFPPNAAAVLRAEDGDYVQQCGIAGTNAPPLLFDFRAWLADRRLHRLLQSDLHARELFNRLKMGCRVADCGRTLLVDYRAHDPECARETIAQHLAGHAIYTRERWLLFHLEEVARRFYFMQPPNCA